MLTINCSNNFTINRTEIIFKVWDFRDPICSVNVYQGHSRSVNSAIFVLEDKIATASDDQTTKLWDLRVMRSPMFTINLNSGVNRLCTMSTSPSFMENFSSANLNSGSVNETYLCLPMDNRDIKVYNLSGERVLRLPRTSSIGHRRIVTSMTSYSNLLFSASFDKMINCWSFDLNPPKANSLSFKLIQNVNFTNNNNSINANNSNLINANKENSNVSSNANDSSNTPLTGGNEIGPTNSLITKNADNSSRFMKSSSPPPSAPPHLTSQPYPAIINSNLTSPPLNHITNNSSKQINTLSKLAERIKI
jgi:hypothetical protein